MADIDAERRMNRSDVAEYLRSFADELDASETTDANRSETDDRTGTVERRDERAPGDDIDTIEDPDSESPDASDDDTDHTTDGERSDDGDTVDGPDDGDGSSRSSGSDESNRSGGRVTFMVGNESATINPPDEVTFEVSVDSESSLIGTGTGRTARFALHWDESDVSEDEELSIQ